MWFKTKLEKGWKLKYHFFFFFSIHSLFSPILRSNFYRVGWKTPSSTHSLSSPCLQVLNEPPYQPSSNLTTKELLIITQLESWVVFLMIFMYRLSSLTPSTAHNLTTFFPPIFKITLSHRLLSNPIFSFHSHFKHSDEGTIILLECQNIFLIGVSEFGLVSFPFYLHTESK